MKLTELQQITWVNNKCTTIIDGCELTLAVTMTEGVNDVSLMTKAKNIAVPFLKNPIGFAIAATWAVDALKHYNANKKYTTTLFAKDQTEKTLYQSIVDDLMKTGHYTLKKSSYVDGGYLWVLKRAK